MIVRQFFGKVRQKLMRFLLGRQLFDGLINLDQANKNVSRLTNDVNANMVKVTDLFSDIENKLEKKLAKSDQTTSDTKNQDNYDKMTLIRKMGVIHLLGGNGISDYLRKEGIQGITLFGNADLIKCVLLELYYPDDIYMTGAFSEQDEKAPLGAFHIFTSIHVFNENVNIRDDVALVCNAKPDDSYNQKILKLKKVKIIELSEVVEKLFLSALLYKPLCEFKERNANIPIVLLFLPRLHQVKNKSENEEKIGTNGINVDKVRRLLENGCVDAMPEAIKRYSSDIEYARNIMATCMSSKDRGVYRYVNKKTPYMNIVDGARKTWYQPDQYSGTVYFFGNSNILGIGTEDKGTIQSHFQQMLNQYVVNNMISSRLVENYSNISGNAFSRMFPLMNSVKFEKNDVIVLSGYDIELARQYGFIVCETQEAFSRPHEMGEVFVDDGHQNSAGNKKIAECLFETFLQNDLLSEKHHNENIPQLDIEDHFEQENEYSALLKNYKTLLSETREQVIGKIGAIVMNCNPFTLGHRYLIEYAAAKVKHLFIFVVEEDKSVFPFKDRFELVKSGTVDLGNVTVLPSGQFIISSMTFADYFDKTEIQDKVIDPSRDVELFAREIAPVLGITARFAGEEPLDNVTCQYNDAMRRILPRHGITFEVIPRKESNGEIISASRVRKLLEAKDFEAISKLVPVTTLDYLKGAQQNLAHS